MKIAICVPAHGDTRAAFTLSLSKMLLRTTSDWARVMTDEPLSLDVFMGSGAIVALVREELVASAERWGADWILWLDSDQTFPPDTLFRLLGSKEPVIGANYPRRGPDARPTADRLDETGTRWPVYTTPAKAEAGEIQPVHLMGLGVCLTSMQALKSVERPIFNELREDHGLMRKLSAVGYAPKIDHALSAEVGHVGTFTWTNQHALAAKARSERQVTIGVEPGTVTGKIGR